MGAEHTTKMVSSMRPKKGAMMYLSILIVALVMISVKGFWRSGSKVVDEKRSDSSLSAKSRSLSSLSNPHQGNMKETRSDYIKNLRDFKSKEMKIDTSDNGNDVIDPPTKIFPQEGENNVSIDKEQSSEKKPDSHMEKQLPMESSEHPERREDVEAREGTAGIIQGEGRTGLRLPKNGMRQEAMANRQEAKPQEINPTRDDIDTQRSFRQGVGKQDQRPFEQPAAVGQNVMQPLGQQQQQNIQPAAIGQNSMQPLGQQQQQNIQLAAIGQNSMQLHGQHQQQNLQPAAIEQNPMQPLGQQQQQNPQPTAVGQKAMQPLGQQQQQYLQPAAIGQNVVQTLDQQPNPQPGQHPFSGMEFFDGSGNKVQSQDKWIVVTSINAPTKDVIALSKVAGWKVVVVGDTKTPKDWKVPNVVLLDVDTQMKMGLQVLKYIPFKSYARKNIGYLFALKFGAKYIYDTDDDNQPNDRLRSFDMEDGVYSSVLVVQTTNITYNPYPHFGQRTIWPRGYPLDLIMGDQPREYKLCKMPTPLLRQGVVNGDPDVDAIYRLIKKHPKKRINVLFDRNAPRVVLPVKTLAPYNSQNTISSYDAFWGLLFPVTLNFRVCDIWRSYWAQRLSWITGHQIGFYTAGTFQFRSPHSYLIDFKDEQQLYHQATDFVYYLKGWQCQASDFVRCIKELSNDMAKKGFWGEKDALLVEAWLQDLETLGYKQPPIKKIKGEMCIKPPSKVIFYPHEQKASFGESTIYNIPRVVTKFDNLKTAVHARCPRPLKVKPDLNLEGFSAVNDILLIITLKNAQTKDSLGKIESFYRPRFSQILYCGVWQEQARNIFHYWQASFIEIANNDDPNFSCLLQAAEMHYLVQGYMVVQEGMMVNYETIQQKDRNATWVMHNWISQSQQAQCQQGTACQQVSIQLDDVTKAVIADGSMENHYSNNYQHCNMNQPGINAFYLKNTIYYVPAYFNKEMRSMSDGHITSTASAIAWFQCLSPNRYIELTSALSITGPDMQTDIVENFDIYNDRSLCPLLGYDA